MVRIRVLVVLLVVAGWWGCATVAPIQSARVRQTLTVGPQFTYENYRYNSTFTFDNYGPADTGHSVRNDTTTPTSGTGLFVPYFMPRLGIARRLEITGGFFPGVPYLWSWSLNAKVALTDNGPNLLFRNLATAFFAGTYGSGGEHGNSDKLARAGVIVSTYQAAPWGDLELVCMPSASYHNWETSSDLSAGQMGLKETAWYVALGAIYRPFVKVGLEVTIGGTLRFPHETEVYTKSAGTSGIPPTTTVWQSPYSAYFSLGYAIGRADLSEASRAKGN